MIGWWQLFVILLLLINKLLTLHIASHIERAVQGLNSLNHVILS